MEKTHKHAAHVRDAEKKTARLSGMVKDLVHVVYITENCTNAMFCLLH